VELEDWNFAIIEINYKLFEFGYKISTAP